MASGRRTSPRVRQNEETFADANEQIPASAEQYRFAEPVPFLCECSRVSTDSALLSLTNHRDARARGEAFILLPDTMIPSSNASWATAAGTCSSRNPPEELVIRRIEMDRDVGRRALFLDDDVILRMLDDGLDLG